MTLKLETEVSALEAQLNSIAEQKPDEGKKKVFVAVPNMVDVNCLLVNKLFYFAMKRDFLCKFHLIPEVRFHDHARNRVVQQFMQADCDYLCFIDSDVDPHPNLLSLVNHDKDIISGNVFCWINNQIMPSIWERAECEQCRCSKIWINEGKVHDPSQYKSEGDILLRWNPINQVYTKFAGRSGLLENVQCRCQGSGVDPFVYRVHRGCMGVAQMLRVDSVGSAALIIAKRVLQQMGLPWFKFLFKEIREIMLTEDHYFCWKAAAMGFEVWADPQMACSHYKTLDLFAVNNLMVKAYEKGREDAKGVTPGGIILPPAMR